MSSLDLKLNLNAFTNQTEAARSRIKQRATDYVQHTAHKVLKEVLAKSPQFTGDYAFNWVLEFGGSGTKFSHFGQYDDRFKWQDWRKVPNQKRRGLGHPVAVQANLAVQNPASNLANIHWNSKIRLVNYAPVAASIEAGGVDYRPQNSGAPVTGMRAYIKTKFPRLVK